MDKVSFPREEIINNVLQKYANTVFRLAFSRTKNKHDAEDILQDVFIKYMNCNIDFKSEEHIKAWLIKVTINCSKNLLTTSWFRKTTSLDESLNDNFITYLKEDSEVYKYVLELPNKYRTVIHLFYYEDMQTSDIAKILNIKESTVRSQLHRARNILKEKMQGDEYFDF